MDMLDSKNWREKLKYYGDRKEVIRKTKKDKIEVKKDKIKGKNISVNISGLR